MTVPVVDDGSTDEIILGTDIVIFGSRHNRLYVSHNNNIIFGMYIAMCNAILTIAGEHKWCTVLWRSIH